MADVVVKFDSDADALKRDLEAVDDLSARAGVSLGGMASAAANLGKASLVAAGAVLALTQQTADAINDLGDMSARTGVAVRTLKGLELAARGSGAQLSDMEGILRKVTATGLEFDDVAASIQSIEDPTERTTKAMELLGEEGGRLVQVLGDKSIDEFSDFAEKFGRDTGPEAAAAAAEWQRATAELTTVLEGLTDASGALPLMNRLVRGFTTGVIVLGEVVPRVFGAIPAWVADTVDSIKTASDAMDTFALAMRSGNFTGASQALERAKEALEGMESPATATGRALDEGIAAGVAKAWDAFQSRGDLPGEFRRMAEEVEGVKPPIVQLKQEFVDFIPVMGEVVSLGRTGFRGLEADATGANEELAKMFKFADQAAKFDKLGKSMASAASFASDGFAVASDLVEAFGKNNEATARKVFAVNKAAALVNIALSTGAAIAANLAIGPPGIPLAAVAGALGAAQFVAASAQQFDGAASPSSGGASAGAGASAGGGADTSPAIIGGAHGGPAQAPRGQLTRSASVQYENRIFDIVAGDSYPGSAFDPMVSNGQRRRA